MLCENAGNRPSVDGDPGSASTQDKRYRLLTSTKTGRAMLRKLARSRRETIEKHFANWSRDDLAQFLDLFRRALTDIHGLFPDGST